MKTQHCDGRNGSRVRHALLVAFVFLLALCASSNAQPNLTFKRLTVNWPTIELYFSVGCNGNPAYNMTKQDMRIYENGVEVRDFTLWCPDPTVRCAISVSLVFDCSGSMSGSGNAGAKQAGHAFVDLMDGVIDEATIIFFNTMVTVQQQMTTNKALLHTAVDALPTGGGTAVWDGIYGGIIELLNNGVNQSRAVIAMTDGGDNASTRTPAEIISLANRYSIRVFTIGLGTGINATELELIATLTGGRYYQTPDAGQLAAIYQEISTIIFACFQECIITYQRQCADGGLRTVELQLRNFCGGTDTKTKTYRAPLDSTTFSNLHMELGSVQRNSGDEVIVPLNLLTPINGEMFYPIRFIVLFNSQHLQFKNALTPAGSLLEQIPLAVTAVPGGVEISSSDRKLINGSGKLLELTFTTQQRLDTLCTALPGVSATFEQGCFLPIIDTGRVCLVPNISIAGNSELCEGSSTVLTAPDGFASYLWSTTETTRSITVDRAGDYWVKAFTHTGDSITSPVFTVVVKPAPKPVVLANGPLTFCLGQSVDLEVAGGVPLLEYQWSNGANTSKITASESGWYWVRVKHQNGCWATSDSLQVVAWPSHVNLAMSGSTAFCVGDSLILTVQGSFASQRWSTGATSRSIVVRQTGAYWVETTEPTGCKGRSDTVQVVVSAQLAPRITVMGSKVLCPNDSVTLDAGEGYTLYRWSNGASTRRITVKTSGNYYAEVRKAGGCVGVSDTVTVTVASPPVIVPSGPITICRGASIELDAGGGYQSYRWSTGEQQRKIRIAAAGAYAVTVVNGNGCTLISSPVIVTVVDSLKPTIVAEGPTVLCEGDTVILDAGEGYASYHWSSGELSRKILVRTQGLYAVTVTDPNGCVGISNVVSVTVQPSPRPVISVTGNPVICEGDSVVLDAGGGYASYLWSNAETTRAITVKTAGSYAVTVWNANGCEGTAAAIDVTVKPGPEKPTITKVGGVLTTEKANAYQWYKDGSELPGESNQFLVVPEAGMYQVRVFAENGCSAISDPFLILSTESTPPSTVHDFTVYPDPNHGTVTVRFTMERPAPVTIEVFNIVGQSQLRHSDEHAASEYSRQLDLRQFQPGIYILRITAGPASWTRKIVRN
ncbi:MAG TPA: T9SS type A sorting domain-containing protein [Bacteroidota bacterium]|nr:T9SS type A sorting domain-containing protein [Bacteroidota bacterium]